MRKLFLISAGVLSLLLAGASVVGIYGIHYVNARTTRLTTDVHCQTKSCLPPLSQCDKHACNFLLLGSDSRAGLSKKQQKSIGTGPQAVQGQRADTIIVVNVNAAENRTVVLHIPRDLLVTIPGHGQNKINSAFSFGPNTMVKTVEGLTGLKINHYVAINFAGFEGLVNALGGVTICVNKPMVDTLAGLNLRHVGCYHMSGRTALAFVRARHVQGDTIPDFSRIARQQQFMRAVIDKLLSAGALIHGFTSLVHDVEKNLVVDKNLNFYDLQDLTRRLSGLGEGGVVFRVVPAVPATINGIDYVEATPVAQRLFMAIRNGLPLRHYGQEQAYTPPSPATVSVRVYNAGGGALTSVVDYLEHAGFDVVGVSTAPPGLTKSVIYYQASSKQQRHVVSSYLPDWPVERSPSVLQAAHVDIVVVVGPDSPGIPR